MNPHPQLGTPIASFGYSWLQTRGSVILGMIGVLCFGLMAWSAWDADAGLAALAFVVFGLLAVAAMGVGIRYWNRANTIPIVLYAKGVLLLDQPTPSVLRWGSFAATGTTWAPFRAFSIRTNDGQDVGYAFVQHYKHLLTAVNVMNALHQMDAAAKADKEALLWTFEHDDPAKTITAYERGLHIGKFWMDYGTVTAIALEDDGRSVRLERLGKPPVVLDAAVTDFYILQALLTREVIDYHLVPKAKQRLQMQELSFSHAVITPAGVRAPDNRFWSWPKLNEALITRNSPTHPPAPSHADELLWFARQVQAPDVLLFMAMVISYIGADFAQDLTAETLLLRLRHANNR